MAENLVDLRRHADDFVQRGGFTYTVIGVTDGEVIGCVYIYPSRTDDRGTDVRSWVRADRGHLDAALYASVAAWLTEHWPLGPLNYQPR